MSAFLFLCRIVTLDSQNYSYPLPYTQCSRLLKDSILEMGIPGLLAVGPSCHRLYPTESATRAMYASWSLGNVTAL